MREGWVETTLGAITTTVKPGSPIGVQRYVGLEHFDSGSPRLSRWDSTVNFSSSSTPFRAGDTLFSKLRPYLRKVAVPDFDGQCTNEALVYRPSSDALSARYLALVLQADAAIDYANASSAGSRMPRTSAKIMGSLPVWLPPLPEQRRIVDLIATLDDTIAAAEAGLGAQQRLHRALRSQAWGSGELTRLASLGEIVTGATPSTKEPTYWDSGDVPFVTPGDIGWDGATIRAVDRKVSQKAAASSKRALSGVGVMQVCIGATAGKCGTINGPALFNQQINCLIGLVDDDATVLAALLASPQFQATFRQVAGSSTMPLVSKSRWSQMEVAWPDAETRSVIAEHLKACSEALTSAENQIEHLRTLRSNLLTALLSGEHEIPEAYDELMEAA